MVEEEDKQEEVNKKGETKDLEEKNKDVKQESETQANQSRSSEELIAAKRVAEFIKINKRTLLNILPFFGLLFAIIIGLYIRTRNLSILGESMLELDSYAFFRYAKYIVENGSLYSVDTMRYVPVYFKMIPSYSVFPYFLAYAYKLIHIFLPSLQQITWHQLYPPIIFGISLLPLFLFIRNVFDDITAVLTVIFISIAPGYLQRTISGFADHESLAMLLMFTSLWLFVKAFKEKENKKQMLFSLLTGIFTTLTILVWGGGVFLYISIALLFAAIYFLEPFDIKYGRLLFLWYLPTILSVSLGYLSLRDFRLIPSHFVFLIYLAEYFFHKIDLINKISFFRRYKQSQKIVYGVLTIVFLLLVNFVLRLTTLSRIITFIRSPLTAGRVGQTVSENAQPFFSDFARNLGVWFINSRISIWIIYFALLGAILLFYKLLSSKKLSRLPLYAYIFLIVVMMFDRYNPSFSSNALFARLFLPSIFILIVSLIWLYISSTKSAQIKHEMEHINFMHLLIIIWFTASFIIAKGAIRIVFAMIPPFCIMASYAFSYLYDLARKQKKNIIKIAGIALWLIIVIGLVSSNSKIMLAQASQSGPSFIGPWQEVCDWIKQNTNQTDVFSHWWDYGYFIQTSCNRATVTDGGNFYGFWNHLLGRHLLLAYSPQEALTFAKTHNARYLLIAPEEIGKFHAFAYIGSDENLDKQSSIGIFQHNPNMDQEQRNATQKIFVGGWPIDKDFVYNNKVLPKNQYFLLGVAFRINPQGQVEGAKALLSRTSNNIEHEIPINCVCEDGLLAGEKEARCKNYNITEQVYPGCFLFSPYINAQSGTIDGRKMGFWVSEKNMKTLFANLYLFNRTWEGLEQVYTDPKRPLSFVNGNQFGPIRVWKMNWDENTPTNQTWLVYAEENYNW